MAKLPGASLECTDFLPIGKKIYSGVSLAGSTWDIWEGNNGTNNCLTVQITAEISDGTFLHTRNNQLKKKETKAKQKHTHIHVRIRRYRKRLSNSAKRSALRD